MTVAAHTQLGPYEILSQIGAGGMGEVYRARDKRIGRDVALKLLVDTRDADENALRRLEIEARTAGSLNHPHLVTIYDVGTHEGAPYVVMELLEGETLRTRLDGNARAVGGLTHPLALRKIVDYASQIARGVSAAHDKGVVHRDLKPENVFITNEGHVKILDFGIAKFALRQTTNDTETETLDTEAGRVVGTIGYMSPEQLQAGVIDHRSDIFSFGVVLYEMLAGRRPFRGNSTVETISAILRDDPAPLNDVDDHISPALALVVRRCLEKSPAERYQSIRDVAFALEAATASTAARAPELLPPSPAGRNYTPVLVAALLFVAALAGVAAYSWMTRPSTAQAVHFAQLTFDEGLETEPSIAPDGSSFVYVSSHAGNADIWLRRVGGDKATNLTADCSESDEEPAFSPDGRQIAYRSERDGGGIFIMGATGESVRRMTDFGHSPAWSPDGRRIVFATESITDPSARLTTSKLYVVEVESGAVSLLSSGDAVQPNWSPDGTRIAYWGLPAGTSERAIWTMPAKGGAPLRVTNDRAMNWKPVWSPYGGHLYFTSDRGGSMNVWRVAIDQRSGEVEGEPDAVTSSAYWCEYPSVTRDGRTLAFSTRANEGAVLKVPIDRTTMTLGKPATVLQGSRRFLTPVPSPDGTQIAVSTLGVQEDVFIIGSEGAGLRQLTNDRFRDRAPRWSPDGSRLMFHSDRGGKYTLWTIRTDGSGLQQISSDPMMDGVFSPDGRLICAIADKGAPDARGAVRRGPVIVDVSGKNKPVPLPAVSKTHIFWPGAWSQDGSQIVGLTLDDAGFQSISTYSLATKSYRLISSTARRAGWLDPSTIVLFELDGKVSTFDLGSGRVRPLGQLPLFNPMRAPNLDMRGGAIFYVSLPTEADVWTTDVSPE